MADMQVIVSGTTLMKNGTIIVSCLPTGRYGSADSVINTDVLVSTIDSKYTERFDDPSYYYGIGDATIVGG